MNKWIERLSSVGKRVAFMGPLLGRIAIGVVFLVSGWGKLHNLDHVTQFFTSLGVPMPGFNAVLVSCTEFFGGLALIVGLGARLVSIPLSITMIVALLTAKLDEIEDIASFFSQIETTYLFVFLWILFAGAGKASLDQLIAWLWKKRQPLSSVAVAA